MFIAAEAARHRPQLNPHSIEIEQRLPHTTAERLTRTPQRSVSPPRDSNLTFKPELNAASIALAEVRAARGQTPADRVQALIRAKEERDRRLQEQRARKQDEEMKECTFKPQIPVRFGSCRLRIILLLTCLFVCLCVACACTRPGAAAQCD